jgi:hypothetical protein
VGIFLFTDNWLISCCCGSDSGANRSIILYDSIPYDRAPVYKRAASPALHPTLHPARGVRRGQRLMSPPAALRRVRRSAKIRKRKNACYEISEIRDRQKLTPCKQYSEHWGPDQLLASSSHRRQGCKVLLPKQCPCRHWPSRRQHYPN